MRPSGANWGGVPSASPYLASARLAADKTASTTRSALLACASFTPSAAAVTVHFSCSFGGNATGAFQLLLDGVKVGQCGSSAWSGRAGVAISQRITVVPGAPCVVSVEWKVAQLNTLSCICGNPDYILDHASIVVTL